VSNFLSLHEQDLLLQVYFVEGKNTPVESPVVTTGLERSKKGDREGYL
jgi:hypothetical protein